MNRIYVLALCYGLIFNVSCKSDDDNGGDNNAPLGVEEGKQQLEDNGISLLSKVENFKNDNALNEIVELAEFINSSAGLGKSTSNTKKFEKTSLKTIKNLASIQTESKDITLFNAKQSIAIVSETPVADNFNEAKGIYEWNSDTEEFEKTGDSDDIIYNITYNENVAAFSFTDFSTELIEDQEVPNKIIANLSINNTIVFSQDFSASFKSDQAIPVSIDNTTTIGAFAFVTSYSNPNNTAVTQSFEFKIGDDVITGYNYTANGNFNNGLDDSNIEDVIDNVTASFKFLDATLSVTANDTGLNSNEELTIDQQVELLNNNIKAELSIKNKSIAKNQFYNDQGLLNTRFLFNDGTTNDFDTYIEGSFTEIEDKFEAVFEAYEDLFQDTQLND